MCFRQIGHDRDQLITNGDLVPEEDNQGVKWFLFGQMLSLWLLGTVSSND
jgi:hypothetical protein